MDNARIARAFEETSALLALAGEDPRRARTYAGIARRLASLEEPVERLVAEDRLVDVPGIGASTDARVRELLATGRMGLLEELRARVPAGCLDLLRVPGLGPVRVREIVEGLGVTSLAELEYACVENRLRDLPGFGPKTQATVLEGIAAVRATEGLRLLSQARRAAVRVLSRLEREPAALRLAVAGATRRMASVVAEVSLIATAHDAAALLDAFERVPWSKPVSRDADRARVLLDDGTPVSLRVVPEPAFAAALFHATGADAHVAAVVARARASGLALREDGLFEGERGDTPVPVAEESDLYARLGIAWFPPECREDGDLDRPPPEDLVSIRDLRGVLHAHTTASDGSASLLDMASRVAREGFAWFGVTDHVRSSGAGRGLTAERAREQWREVDALNASGQAGVPVLKGAECDVLADGALDLDAETLAGFDVVIASVHGGFRRPVEESTARLVRAARDPNVHVLGHPTARLLLGREGMRVDLGPVLDACAESGTAVELNCQPRRMDLDEAGVAEAVRRGVKVSIDPDAHGPNDVENVILGVGLARRARLRARDVLTALPVEEFRAWCAARRGKPPPEPLRVGPAGAEETPA